MTLHSDSTHHTQAQSPGGRATGTLADAVVAALAALVPAADGEAEPNAILWPDVSGQWKSLVKVLKGRTSHLYELGDYSPSERTGPAIWLKCVVGRSIAECAPPVGVVPILYLPGVARQELRAAGDCRPLYQPLVELQYSGRVWHQRNGRDWTLEAFLTNPDTLNLDVAGDAATQQAMLQSLDRLADETTTSLGGRKLDVNFFESLSVSDMERDVLAWMCDPEGFQSRCEGTVFETFSGKLGREYGIEPNTDKPAEAARCLARGEPPWDAIWQRYSDAPKSYPKIQALMANVSGGDFAIDTLDRSPKSNAEAESTLRRDLGALVLLPHAEARARVGKLHSENVGRLERAWAKLGESLLAETLVPLASLAVGTGSPIGGPDVAAAARAYATEGWRVDRDAVMALAMTQRSPDAALVAQVVRSLYLPWLEKSAEHFQSVCKAAGESLAAMVTPMTGQREVCLVFADGLRFDAAALLQEKLESRGLIAKLTYRIAPLPSVTATAKPAVMPLPDQDRGLIFGAKMPETFLPQVRTGDGDKLATTAELVKVLQATGVAVLGPDDTNGAATADRGGWTEVGKIDTLGHKLGLELAGAIEEQVERIARRIAALLEAGWMAARVVTDHGWLLVPGGLNKVDVPASVVESKWSRAAAVKGASTLSVPVVGWHWNSSDRVATPPGACAFRAGEAYAHGGMSPQECVVPVLMVERSGPTATANVVNLRWLGMRCRVKVEATVSPVLVDLRLVDRDPATSIVGGAKNYDEKKGEVALVVANDSHEKATAVVVVLAADGTILDRMQTKVGGS